jgi:hypothetical protein
MSNVAPFRRTAWLSFTVFSARARRRFARSADRREADPNPGAGAASDLIFSEPVLTVEHEWSSWTPCNPDPLKPCSPDSVRSGCKARDATLLPCNTVPTLQDNRAFVLSGFRESGDHFGSDSETSFWNRGSLRSESKSGSSRNHAGVIGSWYGIANRCVKMEIARSFWPKCAAIFARVYHVQGRTRRPSTRAPD